MSENIFVTRKTELEKLESYLLNCLANQGKTVFITGEAGAGKTTLMHEFVKQSLEVHKDLIVSIGECNSQTGLGDPYLPFREILSLLTGDVEAKLAQRAISKENVRRLKQFFQTSGEALVEVGPDLIGIFVPAAGLIAKVGSWLAGKAGWLNELKQIDKYQRQGNDEKKLDQNHIFEEYYNVLKVMSMSKPLLLIIEDLQWADDASLALFFYLARKLLGNRVLLLGTFRSGDVAIGRGEKRHPLTSIFNEIKRYQGDIEINLDSTGPDQSKDSAINIGEEFVNAYLDSAYFPNQFDKNFRSTIAQCTEGHPLFTVELLTALKERGAIQLISSSAPGAKSLLKYWIQVKPVEISELPEKVEAVIAERIGRLSTPLRKLLEVAAVEGEEFTVNVLTNARQIDEQYLITQLAQELDKKHQLIREIGVVYIGTNPLFRFRFRHSLFQTFIYNNLGLAEKVLLHWVVGRALEEIYAEDIDAIALQLAYHFMRDKDIERAIEYSIHAGDIARKRYANTEALRLYDQAIELINKLPKSTSTNKHLFNLYARKGEVLHLTGQYHEAIKLFQEMLNKANGINNRQQVILALGHLGHLYRQLDRNEDALYFLGKAASLARDEGNQDILTNILYYMGTVYYSTGDSRNSIAKQQESLEIAKKINNADSIALAHHGLGEALWSGDESDRAIPHLQTSLNMVKQLGNKSLESENLYMLGLCNSQLGNLKDALSLCQKSYRICHEIGDRYNLAWCMYSLAHCLLNLGDYEKALGWTQKSLEKNRQINSPRLSIWNLDTQGEIYLALGDVEKAIIASNAALRLFSEKELGSWRKPIILSNLGVMYLSMNELEKAEIFLNQALKEVQEGASSLEGGRIYYGFGLLSITQNKLADAASFADQLLTLAKQKNQKPLIARAMILKGEISIIARDFGQATQWFEQAHKQAKEMSSSAILWQCQFGLGRSWEATGHKEGANGVYQKAFSTIQQIANRISNPELKTQYMEQKSIQDVLTAIQRTK